MPPIGFTQHNHSTCISDSIRAAEKKCKEEGLQFTPVRRRVLEILLEEHRSLGAYDVLERLRAEGLGSQPPVAYRALDFLTKNGFVHKVQRSNAFIACAHPHSNHTPAFLICRNCNYVAETEVDISNGRLANAAHNSGFTIEHAALEAEGICPNCSEDMQ